MASLARHESIALILALAISPFWFFRPFGVNFGVTDMLLIATLASYVLRTKRLPLAPSVTTMNATFLFVGAATVSLTVAANPMSGLLNVLQYILIFFVAIPIAIQGFQNSRDRHIATLGLWAVLNGLTVWAVYQSMATPELRHLTLNYANQNQLYWLLASSILLNIGIGLDESTPGEIRGLAFAFVLPQLYLILGGLTLSAILLTGTGVWLLGVRLALVRGSPYTIAYSALTATGILSGALLAFLWWDWVYVQGSLGVRFEQYQTAVEYGTQNFPLGIGIESSEAVLGSVLTIESIHNFFFAYFLEIGIVGAIAFTLILSDWVRSILIPSLVTIDIRMKELAVVNVFAGGIVVMLVQPVPVQRFWWLVYALTWSVVHSGQTDENATDATAIT